MSVSSYTKTAQSKLSDYVRSGTYEKIDGVNNERVKQYRRLVFNVINGTLIKAYPILHNNVSEEQWEDAVNHYFSTHDCQEARVWLMPKEFYTFLVKHYYKNKWQIPALDDLLLLEWIEIEVHTMSDLALPEAQEIEDIWHSELVLDPEYRLISLEYPVHTKKLKDIGPQDKAQYFVLVYRRRNDGDVQFWSLSPIHAFVFERLSLGQTLTNIKEDILIENASLTEKELVPHLEQFINQLIEKKIVVA